MPRHVVPSLLIVLLGLAACGGESRQDAPGVYVRTLQVDGPPPPDLFAIRLDEKGRPTTSYPLTPAGGDEADRFVAEGAPRGAYIVRSAGGWSMLTQGRPIPLDPGGTAAGVQLGRPHTLYLAATKETQRASLRWGVRTVATADRPSEVLEVELLREPPHGYVVAVRVPPEAWSGELEAVGYYVEGPPGIAPELEKLGNLAEPVRFTPSEKGYPVLAQVKAALTAPLTVTLVPATAETKVDDVPVRVELDDVPLLVRYEEKTNEHGAVRFASISDIGRELRVSAPPHDRTFGLDERTWHDIRDLYLLVLQDADARAARVTLPEDVGSTLDQVMVRGPGAPAFGLVPFELADGELTFRAPRGDTVVLLRAGRTWSRLSLEGAADVHVDAAPPFESAVTVQGQVSGDFRGATVLLFRQEGDQAVVGNGFVLRVNMSGRFHGLLPPGTYHVEVLSPRGTWKKPVPVQADQAGGQVHLNLRAR